MFNYLNKSNTIFEIKQQKFDIFHPTYYDPYFLGLWLGDGNSRSLLITTENLEIVEYLNIFAKTHGYELIKRNNCNCGNASEYFLKNAKHDAYMRKYFTKKLFLFDSFSRIKLSS